MLVLLAASIGLPISWMVKDDWGKGPVGAIIRQLGGVPIDRSAPHGMVGQMIDEMKRREELYLVIPPEGTRKRTEYWKSGFYRIAVGADVPVVPGFLDYASKTGGFGDPIYMTGDVAADMDKIRAVYTAVAATPRYPDKFGPIRLREESEAIPGAHLK